MIIIPIEMIELPIVAPKVAEVPCLLAIVAQTKAEIADGHKRPVSRVGSDEVRK